MTADEFIESRQDNTCLKNYLNSMPRYKRVYLGHRIAEECNVTYPTFRNWLMYITKIPELHKHKIEEILGEKIFSTKENS